MTMFWYDLAGYIGVALMLLAYLLLQAHKLRGNGLIYQLMNVLGAIGVMLSLLFGAFNAPAFFMELAWLLIGVYGIAHSARVRQQAREAGHKTALW
jgi:predicted tellurium resistance membrane protein TerC